MNKKTYVVIFVTAVALGAASRYVNSLHQDLYGRFPNHDRKIVRKAYRQFLKNSRNNVYGPMDDFSDEKMDEFFLDIVNNMK